MKNLTKYTILTLILLMIFASCKKDKLIDDPNAKLSFSVDTVLFDTVFSNVGSVTKRLIVYNNHNSPIMVSNIRLAGGKESDYRININGYESNNIDDMKIPAEDSIFIFIEVTVNPGASNSPFVVQDSIVFQTNSNIQDIDLVAWGQDAHYFNKEIISQDMVWNPDKPYLIYNYLYVDSNSTLTINPGCIIHFHKNCGMHVDGTLIANGTFDEKIIFCGDRLESAYDDIPGQWGGIRFYSGSGNHIINYAEIKNAIVGIQIGTLENETGQSLNISNTIISNMNYAGLFSYASTVISSNNVIANCGYNAVALLAGGNYEFYHTTIANYWDYANRTEAALTLSNNIVVGEGYYLGNLNKAYFGNCIIYGDKEGEVAFSEDNSADFNYEFANCFMKVKSDFETSDQNHFTNIYRNTDPGFKDISDSDYSLDTLAGAKDKGDIQIVNTFPYSPSIATDIEGESRTSDLAPDPGAYERIE